ncbi:MAG: YeiH family protein [Culicoidibacterales bacterium]
MKEGKNVENIVKKIKPILPGLFISVVVYIMSLFLAKFVPDLGAGTIAIFLGILLGNTIFTGTQYNDGTKFAESNLLSYSVVLLGGTLSIQSILQLGINGIIYIIVLMGVTIIGTMMIGKRMGFSTNFTLLMAGGNAVCGSSAIASIAPAIQASDEDKALSITFVNMIGTVLMVLLPVIAGMLYQHELTQTSALIGGTLQSVGQVVASGSMVSPEVKELATIFKIVRVIMIVVVVIWFGNLKAKMDLQELQSDETNTHRDLGKRKPKAKVPWYVIGFFITCGLFTVGIISNEFSHGMKEVSHVFEVVALAGIGLRVKIADLIAQGAKTALYGLAIALLQIIGALLLIQILF